jgi:hypothetical protein
MLKIIVRTLLILAVATLIGSGLYFAVNHFAGQGILANLPGGDFGARPSFNPPASGATGTTSTTTTTNPANPLPRNFGGRGGGDFGGRDGSGRGWTGILLNLIIIAAITAGVVLVQKLYSLFTHKPTPQAV